MIDIAISPCPNDTFTFDAWVHQKIHSPLTPQPTLADIQQLNCWALEARFSVTKVSASLLSHISQHYELLPVGAAIGNYGPKLIAKEKILSGTRIAIPGEQTTACLLFRALFGKQYSLHFCRYEEVVPLIHAGKVDAGVIIHETRFTFARDGLVELADLGALFQERYKCLIPLGVAVAKRSLSEAMRQEVTRAIRASLLFAKANPMSSREYVLQHAQEKEEGVVSAHIDTYVTEETFAMSAEGLRSIHTLMEL